MLLALLLLQAVNRLPTVQTATATVATAGVSQQILPADADRSYLMCQAASTNTGNVLIDFGRSAGTGSIELAPLGTVSFMARSVPVTTVTFTSATVGNRLTCKTGGI